MTVVEAACVLIVSESTIYRYVDEGKLKWSKIKGRIPTDLVKRLMESERSSQKRKLFSKILIDTYSSLTGKRKIFPITDIRRHNDP